MIKCQKSGETFIYPAKKTKLDSSHADIYGGMMPEDFTERSVCPFCCDLHLEQFEPQVESVKQVNYDEVDALLKTGYVIAAEYANKATMHLCKKEEKK